MLVEFSIASFALGVVVGFVGARRIAKKLDELPEALSFDDGQEELPLVDPRDAAGKVS